MTSDLLAPALLALGGSVMFAVAAHLQSFGLRSGDVVGATVVILLTTFAIYAVAMLFVASAGYWWTWAAGMFAIAGLFRPALSMMLWVGGIHWLGPTMNGTFSASSPLFAAAFGILLLGEPMTLPIAAGTLAIVAGVALAAWRPGGLPGDWPLWALALPFGSTVLRAISQSILKLGYGEVPSPVFASFVSTAVSLALLLAWFLASGRRIEGTRRDIGWLVLAGAVNALAIYLLNAALETGQLIMVSPIAAISPVFSLMIGLYFRTERIDWRKLAMLALVVPGVLVIVVGK